MSSRPGSLCVVEREGGRTGPVAATGDVQPPVSVSDRPSPSRRKFITQIARLAGACTWGFPAVVAAFGERRLYINTAFGPPISTPTGDGFFDRLMDLIFRDLGYRVTIQTPPAERALMLANLGIDDGDGPRIPTLDIADAYINLIAVPEPILDVEFVAFTGSLRFETEGWESLNPYTVAIVTGWKILERNILGTEELILVKDADSLFHLLKSGRTEVAVIDRLSGLVAAKEAGMNYFNILEPPLARTPMLLYLHRKHEWLGQTIASKLRALKDDGTYARLERETLSHVVNHATYSGS